MPDSSQIFDGRTAEPSDPPPLPAITSGPTHPDGGVPAHQRLRALLEVLVCSGVPTQLAIGALLAALGLGPSSDSASPTTVFVVALLLADTFVLVALMAAFLRSGGESARALWLGSRPIGRELLLGLMLIPLVFVLVIVLMNVIRLAVPWLHNVPTNPLEEMVGTGAWEAAMFAFVAIVAGGVREELQRAFLLHRFEQYLGGAWTGVVVLSVAFGLGHYVQGWDAVIATGLLGAFWAIVYLRRRSSIAPIVSHAGFNSLEVALVAVRSVRL